MVLWREFVRCVWKLRPATSRKRTFFLDDDIFDRIVYSGMMFPRKNGQESLRCS